VIGFLVTLNKPFQIVTQDARMDGTRAAPIDDLIEFLSNPAVWTSLHFSKISPIADIENFGYGQPLVRRSAWSILHSLLRNCKGQSFMAPISHDLIVRLEL